MSKAYDFTSIFDNRVEIKFCSNTMQKRKKLEKLLECTYIITVSTTRNKHKWGNYIMCKRKYLSICEFFQETRNLVIVSDPQPLRLLVTPPVNFTNIAMSSGSFSVRSDSHMFPPMNSWTIFRSAERQWKSSFSSSWSIRSCLDSQLTFQDRMAL